MTAAGIEWTPYLPRPTAKRALAQLRQQGTHGGRLHGIAEARRLWERLDVTSPRGPEDPENGSPADVIQYAQMGRGYIRIALGETTAKSLKYWREIRRAHIHNGWGEVDLFEEYFVAKRRYRERHRREEEKNRQHRSRRMVYVNDTMRSNNDRSHRNG